MEPKRSESLCESPRGEISEDVCVNLEEEFINTEDSVKSDNQNMSVFARIRPMLPREEEAGYTKCIGAIDEKTVRAVVPKTSVKFKNSNQNGQEIMEDFTYTQAFGPEVGQFKFFEETVMSTMQNFIDGQNCLVFSYGITNSGKTYTLQGNEDNPGLIILALKLFFASIEHQLLIDIFAKPDKYSEVQVVNENDVSKEVKLKDTLLRTYMQEFANKTSDSVNMKSFANTLCDGFSQKFKPEQIETTLPPEEMEAAQSAELMKVLCKESADKQIGKCNIWISFIEIYNEYVYDLLQQNILENGKRRSLQLAEDKVGDVYIKGATEVCVSDVDEALKLLHLGRQNLKIASTKLNYQSSRSHCIYTVKVVRFDEDMSCARVNRLSFCDLAGSERASKSEATGMRLKEASYINTSLLVLGRCMEQLRLNQTAKHKKMIPFRDSKLTRLFSGHFLGKGIAVMIANASPCELTFDETLNVLRFSAVAKELKLNDSYISMASNSLKSITSQWAQSRRPSSLLLDESADLDKSDFDKSMWDEMQEKDEMISKLLDLADELRANLEKEKREKANLEFTIRQDVVEEYSKWADKHIEELKEIHDYELARNKEIYEDRYNEMEKEKDARIKELEELAYAESEDESFRSTQENSSKLNVTVTEDDNKSEKLEELESIKEENRILKLDMCSLKNQLEIAMLESQKKTEEIEKFEKEIKKYSEQLTTLTATLETETTQKNEQKEQIEKLSTDLVNLKQELNTITEEFDNTKQELEKKTSLLTELQDGESSLQHKYADTNSKLQESLQVLEQYEKEIAQLKSNISEAEIKSNELMEAKKSQEEAISSLSQELTSATDLNESLKEKLKIAEAAVNDEKHESRKSLEGLTKEFKDQVEKYELSQQRYEELEKNNAELSVKHEELQKRYDAIHEENVNLCGKYDALKSEFDKITEEITIANKEVGELKERLKKSEKLCESLQTSKKDQMDLDQVVTEQKAKIASLESECEAFRVESSSLLNEINTLVKERAAFSSECESLKTELKQIKQLHEELTDKFNSEKTESQEKLSEMKSKLEEAENQISEHESKIASLVNEHANCKTVEDELNATIEKQALTNEEKVKELKGKLSALAETLATVKAKISDLESEAESSRAENGKLLTKISELEEGMTVEKSNYEKMKNEYETATKSNEELISSLKTNINNLEENKVALLHQLEEANELIENNESKSFLDTSKSFAHDESRELEQSFSEESRMEMENTLSDLKVKLVEMETECKKHMDAYEAALENARNMEAKLNSLTSEMDAKLGKVTESLDQKEKELTALKAECNTFKEEINQLKNTNESLQGSYTELTAKFDTMKLKLSESEQSLLAKTTAMVELDSTLKKLQEECPNYESSIQKLQGEKSQLEEKCDNFCNINTALKKEIEELNARVETYTVNIKKLEEKNSKLENSSSSYSEEIAKLSATHKEHVEKLAVAAEDISKLEEEKQTLSERLEKLMSEKENTSKLSKLLETNERKAESKIKSLENKLAEYEKEIQDKKRQILEKEASIADLEKAVLDSQEQLKQLESDSKKQPKTESDEVDEEVEPEKTVVEKVEKDKKKKKVTISKKERVSDDKENSDSNTENHKEKDAEVGTKRTRRGLRSRQGDSNIIEFSDSETDTKSSKSRKRKSSDEFLPPKKVQKKTVERKPSKKAPKMFTDKSVPEESMSPIQKMSKFVGTAIRNVANTVSNMPSPRVTRQRRKLFNIESTSTSKNWKY